MQEQLREKNQENLRNISAILKQADEQKIHLQAEHHRMRQMADDAINRINQSAYNQLLDFQKDIRETNRRIVENQVKQDQVLRDIVKGMDDKLINYQINGKNIFKNRDNAESFYKDYLAQASMVDWYSKNEQRIDPRLNEINTDLKKLDNERQGMVAQLKSQNYQNCQSKNPAQQNAIFAGNQEVKKIDHKMDQLKIEKAALQEIKEHKPLEEIKSHLLERVAHQHQVTALQGPENKEHRAALLKELKPYEEKANRQLNPLKDDNANLKDHNKEVVEQCKEVVVSAKEAKHSVLQSAGMKVEELDQSRQKSAKENVYEIKTQDLSATQSEVKTDRQQQQVVAEKDVGVAERETTTSKNLSLSNATEAEVNSEDDLDKLLGDILEEADNPEVHSVHSPSLNSQ